MLPGEGVSQEMEFRRLGRSGLKVSPLGLGTARMAGMGFREDLVPQDLSQTKKDAVRQIQAAVDLGVNLFDTADNFGQGLSERILGEALRGRPDDILVVTKFGKDPSPDQEDPWSLDAGSVERKCEGSLKRLGVECLDLYLLHRRDYPLELAPAMMEMLENQVRAGKIRYYGWSTDDVEMARIFARGEHCTAIEHRLNVFNDNAAMLDLCRDKDLASLNRVPLLTGVLTGRWSAKTKLEEGDPRAKWFAHEEFLKVLACAKAIEPYLTGDGRSYTQGALGWIWARSPLAIPLPGFCTLQQLQDLLNAWKFGPLPPDVMQPIKDLVKSSGIALN